MAEPLSARIMRLMPQAMHMYHRLILVVAPLGAGKTAALREVAQQTGYNYINANLELSQCMLELTQRQRQLQVSGLVRDIIRTTHDPVVLLDNLEILFDVSLKLDPLRCLHTCFVRRSSSDRETVFSRRNVNETGLYDRSVVGTFKRALRGRIVPKDVAKLHTAGMDWKRAWYARGDRVAIDVAPFLEPR